MKEAEKLHEGKCLGCGIEWTKHDGVSRTCTKLQQCRRTLKEIHSTLARTTQSHNVVKARELAKKALAETAP